MSSGINEPTCKKIQNYIFKFSDLLGQGNFSKVYKAHNQVTNQIVAIKIVQLNSLKSKKLEQLLFSEIEVLKKLNHPNILRCYQVFTSNRNCYIITQLCNQGDLQSKLRSTKYFNEEKALPIIKDIYLGLEYLADKNVIHRDLKVANIFMHNGKAKIADFGFAKFTKTKFKDINIGSPIYMSPEGLIENIYGPKTDVWAFGIMMFQLLHGQTPFSHCKTQSELKYCISIPIGWNQLKSQLTNNIKEVLLKCLQVKQDKRLSISQLKQLNFFQLLLINNSYQNQMSIVGKSESLERYKQSQQYNKMDKNVNKSGFNWKDLDISNSIKENGRPAATNSYINKKLSPNKSMDQNEYRKNAQFSSYMQKASRQIQPTRNFIKNQSQQTQIQVQKQRSPYSTQSRIISGQMGFKTCVNILHYCRLIYKYVTTLPNIKQSKLAEQSRKNVFVRWLAIVVKVVNNKIDNQQVLYQGENAKLREQKLKEVSKQYEKKYSKQLNLNLAKINPQESSIANYQYMNNYFYTVFQQIDSLLTDNKYKQNKNVITLGHYIIMIYETTKVLKRCYDQRNYKSFQTYKDVQTLLNMKKEEMDLASYWWYKKRINQNDKK